MMFENHGYNQVYSDPGWMAIINNSFQLSNFSGVTHPSQPNYIAQLGGSFFNVASDSPVNLTQQNLCDLVEKGGYNWKSYQENYTQGTNGDCNPVYSIGNPPLYYRKHNPMMSFLDISTNPTRCKNIVDAQALLEDLQVANLPNFGYWSPNINDDSHNQNLTYSSAYLETWLNTYYTPFPLAWKETLLMITFDEDDVTASENNHIAAFFKSPKLVNTEVGGVYNHYSVTRFVENNFCLGSLGLNDADANDFADAFVIQQGQSLGQACVVVTPTPTPNMGTILSVDSTLLVSVFLLALSFYL